MKKLFTILAVAFAAIAFCAPQQAMANEPTSTESSAVLYSSYYDGVIGSNLYIAAYLQVHSNGSYSGWYYYKKKGSNNKLYLTGYKDRNGVVRLQEHDINNNVTGGFEGTFNRYGEFNGVMYVVHTGKRFACQLTPR